MPTLLTDQEPANAQPTTAPAAPPITTTQTPGSTQPASPASATPPPSSNFALPQLTPKTESTVAGQVQNLTGKNSGLLQQARSVGMKQAARRGLTNSSIAAGATQAAVYDRVLPIAQQDASTNANFQLNDRQYEQGLKQNEQQFGFNSALSAQNADEAARAAQAQFGFNTQLSLQDHLQRSGLSAQEAEQAAAAAFKQYGYTSQLSQQDATQRSGLSAQEAQQALTANREQFGFQSALNQQQVELDIFRQETLLPLTERLKKLDASLAADLDKVQSENDLVLQNSLAASTLYATGLQSLSQLYSTAGLSAAQMAAGRESILSNMTAGLGFMADVEKGFSGIPGVSTPTAPPTSGTAPAPTTGTGTGTAPTLNQQTQTAINNSPEFTSLAQQYQALKNQVMPNQRMNQRLGGILNRSAERRRTRQMTDLLNQIRQLDPSYAG